MQDDPTPVEIIAAVAAFLRDDLLPQLTGANAFKSRIAANALDLVRRQLLVPADEDAHEVAALSSLLGRTGDAASLNDALAAGIADGSVDASGDQLKTVLWSITEAKLAVDQPNYGGLARARLLRGSPFRPGPNNA